MNQRCAMCFHSTFATVCFGVSVTRRLHDLTVRTGFIFRILITHKQVLLEASLLSRMAKNDQSFYPLRVLASDFFVPYWKHFLSSFVIAPEHCAVIQSAARDAVDLMMDGEEEYWNIDFSEPNAKRVWLAFEKRVSGLPADTYSALQTLILQLAVSPDESTSADYLLNLITRLRFDSVFRDALEFSDADAALLDCAYEFSDEGPLSMHDVQQQWLQSDTLWDKKLQHQTPDLPESVAVIFSMAYEPKTNLPLIKSNLREVLEVEERYTAFVLRLEGVFAASLSENVEIKFPKIMSA
jgi:hypothetical protein